MPGGIKANSMLCGNETPESSRVACIALIALVSIIEHLKCTEPDNLCPWAPIWSTWVPNVDHMGTHGHKMFGSEMYGIQS